MACLAQYLGPWIEVLVNPVTKTEQAERIIPVARTVDEFRDIVLVADFIQHVQHSFIGTAMRRPPKRGNASGDAGKRVRAGGTGKPHCRCRSVLFMIGMQDEDLVHGVCQDRVYLIVLRRYGKAHMKEILGITQIVARVVERLPR